MTDTAPIYQIVADIIAELSSIDLEQINPDSILDEELFLTDADLVIVLQKIHQHWPEVRLSLVDMEEVTTVQNLVDLVIDELELG